MPMQILPGRRQSQISHAFPSTSGTVGSGAAAAVSPAAAAGLPLLFVYVLAITLR